MARSTEGVFAFTYIFEQRFGQRWQDGVYVLIGVLFDLVGNVVGRTERIFKETHLHTQIVQADVQR
ncbi:hypothetical protein D3C78_1557060 [compost metagenome]